MAHQAQSRRLANAPVVHHPRRFPAEYGTPSLPTSPADRDRCLFPRRVSSCSQGLELIFGSGATATRSDAHAVLTPVGPTFRHGVLPNLHGDFHVTPLLVRRRDTARLSHPISFRTPSACR